ncbi:MAG TPA: gamma-glutamyl-gamma-aminobutyrate hydrolase family protein [Bryobacteraceae bacterium]|nr:gamma-glutamyl-gamma-aminobutyrate hydrolase family protein [Bryobacteraceae bacterium]
MHVLAFRHVRFEHLGLIAPALESRGISFEYVDLSHDPEAAIGEEPAGGFIFMGGPMSANDDLPCIRREIRLIERVSAGGKPVLGICLGAQLLAKALGARVYRNPVKEIGWYPVQWSHAAAVDPLLAGLSGEDTVFHWHGETFDLPPGAELLASSERCRNQAFRWGSSAYGFQFHLEVTPEMIADWVNQDLNSGDVRELESLPDPAENAARLRELSGAVFGRWADLVRLRAGT